VGTSIHPNDLVWHVYVRWLGRLEAVAKTAARPYDEGGIQGGWVLGDAQGKPNV
jgi:hypothetical protein